MLPVSRKIQNEILFFFLIIIFIQYFLAPFLFWRVFWEKKKKKMYIFQIKRHIFYFQIIYKAQVLNCRGVKFETNILWKNARAVVFFFKFAFCYARKVSDMRNISILQKTTCPRVTLTSFFEWQHFNMKFQFRSFRYCTF